MSPRLSTALLFGAVATATAITAVAVKRSDFGRWWPATTTLLAAAAVAAAYRFSTSTFGHWRNRDVPYLRPVVPLLGNLTWLVLGVEHGNQLYDRAYELFRGHRYGGIYQMRMPYLMIRDPKLINRMLIKDFAHFTDHGFYTSGPRVNQLANGLFNMDGVQWKTMRAKLSPGFTSNRLKLMHGQVKECSEQLKRNVDGAVAAGGGVLEVRDVLAKYSTDVIGTCAFGLQLHAIDDDQSAFRRHGLNVFEPSLRSIVKELVWMVSPALRKALRISDFPPATIEFFAKAFSDTMKYRERNQVVRNDLMQALMQARDDLVVNKTEPTGEPDQ